MMDHLVLAATVSDGLVLGIILLVLAAGLIALADPAGRLANGPALVPGAEIGLGLPEEHRVLFDASTGKALAEKNPQQDYGADHRQTAPRDGRKAQDLHPASY